MERFWMWLAWRLPRRLVYWAYIRVAAEATTEAFPDRTPFEVSLMDGLKAWKRG